MTERYSRDTRVIRPGEAGSKAPPTAGAGPTAAAPSASGDAGGLVAELRPYFPRMAVGAALMLFAELWWSGRHRRKEKKRERKRRQRRRR